MKKLRNAVKTAAMCALLVPLIAGILAIAFLHVRNFDSTGVLTLLVVGAIAGFIVGYRRA